jgi:hypothetical protein
MIGFKLMAPNTSGKAAWQKIQIDTLRNIDARGQCSRLTPFVSGVRNMAMIAAIA